MSDDLSPFDEGPEEEGREREDLWEREDLREPEALWDRDDRPVRQDPQARRQGRAREDVERRQRDRVRSNPGGLIGGAIMLLLGIGLLLRNLGIDVPFFRNWWAVFILIPAVSSLTRVWNELQTQGRLSSSSTSDLVWGLVLLMVAVTFLFGLAWSLMLPALLILAGISILITAIVANR